MNIQKLQHKLNEILPASSNIPLTEDSILGTHTIAAIKQFQSINNLQIDGIAGPETLKKLFPDGFSYEIDALRFVHAKETSIALRAFEYLKAQVGVKELTGNNDGCAVETFLHSVSLSKGAFWCMAFIYWGFKQAAYDLSDVNPLKRTGSVMQMWYALKLQYAILPDEIPQKGDIFIMSLGEGRGHTGVVESYFKGYINTVEGNTNDNGSANGDGVYDRMRDAYDKKIIGYLRIV